MPFSHLTPRERAVADLVLAKLSVAAIARELDMAPNTVRSHVRYIACKLANPHDLPALRLIRSYAAVVNAARSTDPVPTSRAAERWSGAAAQPRPPT